MLLFSGFQFNINEYLIEFVRELSTAFFFASRQLADIYGFVAKAGRPSCGCCG